MSKYIKLEDAISGCREKQIIEGDAVTGIRHPAPDEIINDLLDLPTIEVSEDCISRSALRKEMEMYGTEITLIDTAPSVIPQVPNEDCISRVDLRRSLARPLENNNADEMYWKGWHDCTVAVETRIADAPSVTAEQSSKVHCKDCRWSEPNREGDYDCKCHIPIFRVPEDGWCYLGERTEE